MKRAIAKKSIELGIGCCKIAYPELGKTLQENYVIVETLENNSGNIRSFIKTLISVKKMIKYVFSLIPFILAAFLVIFIFLETIKLYAISQENLGMKHTQIVIYIDEFYALILAIVGRLWSLINLIIVGFFIIIGIYIACRL